MSFVFSRRWLWWVIIVTIFLHHHDASAQTVVWNNFSGTPDPFYHNGVNWVGFNAPSSSATARFGTSATYEVWWNGSTVAVRPSVGRFHVVDGFVTLVNQDTFTQRQLTINSGSFSALSISGDSFTRLKTQGVHLNSGAAEILDGAWFTVDGSHAAGTSLTVSGAGMDISGIFRIESGGVANNTIGYIGRLSGSAGTTTVTGAGSQWNNTSSLRVGATGNGILNVTSGAVVTNTTGFIGHGTTSTGDANVNGGSQWNNSSALYVGYSGGTSTLNVFTGGVVTNTSGFIGYNAGSNGTATIDGSGSQWNNSSNLYIGGTTTGAGGNGTLNINTGGQVTVGGTTKIWSTGNVNLNGGQLDFGQTSFAEFDSINAVSGTMTGTVNHAAFTDAANMSSLNNGSVNLVGVLLANTGTIHGTGTIGVVTNNLSTGELYTTVGEMLRMTAAGNSNSGEINNFGGTVRFEQDITNLSGGLITGRGQYIAEGGWTNQAVMAFSGGPADVLGDLLNDTGGQIVTSGGATTTFYDDVVHNGTEIRTSENSNTVFFGSQSGSGAFTGTGTVYYEGDLRPGNSPDVIHYEGSVVLGSDSVSFFELGGLNPGEYDRLNIDGDLTLDGQLSIGLLNGFSLDFDEEFVIANVDGALFGNYQGLEEGAVVGNFGGMNLFISYAGGDGNDVVLFTSVPEPATAGLFGLAFLAFGLTRRRRFN